MELFSHLLLAVLVGRGPRVDVDRFVPLLNATLEQVWLDAVLADAGYDSEPNHQHARDHNGVRYFIPATAGRPTTKPPSGRYRRLMKSRLNKNYGKYGQRWQVETSISMLKRRLATSVNGRSYWSQCRELLLLAITYNLMILYAAAGFLQSSPVPVLLEPLSSSFAVYAASLTTCIKVFTGFLASCIGSSRFKTWVLTLSQRKVAKMSAKVAPRLLRYQGNLGAR